MNNSISLFFKLFFFVMITPLAFSDSCTLKCKAGMKNLSPVWFSCDISKKHALGFDEIIYSESIELSQNDAINSFEFKSSQNGILIQSMSLVAPVSLLCEKIKEDVLLVAQSASSVCDQMNVIETIEYKNKEPNDTYYRLVDSSFCGKELK